MPCDRVDPFGSYLQRIINRYPTSRFAVELLTHCSQCLFMFGIAAERFILVCYPTRAKEVLSVKRRVAFCVSLTVFFLLIPAIPAYGFYLGFQEISVTLGTIATINLVNTKEGFKSFCLVSFNVHANSK